MIKEFFNDEYIIKDMIPIRPLMNFVYNEKVIASYNQFGFGEVKGLTEVGFRTITNGERLVYIKENNTFYDANRNYKNLPIGYDLLEKNQVLMLKSNLPFSSYEVSDINFKGIYNDLSSPKGIYNDSLTNTNMSFDGDNSSAIQFNIELNPFEEKEINIVCAIGKEKRTVFKVINKYLSNESYYLEREKNKKVNDEINNKVVLSSSDEYLNVLTLIWLKRQINLGKTWGRVYGKGFRDVMQDISSFVIFDYKTAKEKILSTLKYQFENGNTIRQFEPILDYPYQVGAVWIIDTILAYLK